MRNIWTIARKELRSYFDHPTAYILVVVFLALNFFFYFRSAFLAGEASVRPMFDLLPWIFLFFIPAVAMGTLAEERRHGTLEVVLSHPLREHEFLLGKYLGNLLFVEIALAATLVAPLSLFVAGRPDLGVVVAQYVGATLLAAAMVAVGMAASALTRNQITAFILGTATLFVFMLAGSELVQVGLPAWLGDTVAQLGILTHFYNVTRGVLDLRDVVFFVTLGGAFLALAYWLLLRDRLNRSGSLYRNLQVGTIVIIAIAVVANLFGRYIPGRLDLTAENLYTLSDGTRDILEQVDDVVTINLFVSEELPTQVQTTERDIRDVLRDFRRYSDGNVQMVEWHPDESEQARQTARELGVAPVQFNVMRREELQLKQGWLGIAVQYADESEAIPFVRSVGDLEYRLAGHVWKLTRTETPRVAFVTGYGGATPRDYASFRSELSRSYQVSNVNLAAEESALDPELDAVVVAGPTQPLDDRARQALEEYLAGDGRVLYLGEGVEVNLRFLMGNAIPDSARDLVEDFGVRVNGDLIYDLRSNESINMPGEYFSYVVSYPYWVRALPASDHAVARDLNSVFLPWASSLDTLSMDGREFTPLLVTSRYAGKQTGGRYQVRPGPELSFSRENLETRLLAVAVEGALAPRVDVTAGASAETELASGSATGVESPPAQDTVGASPDQPGDTADTAAGPTLLRKEVRQGPPAGRVVVVGDADFLRDQFLSNSSENLVFGLNALDWLTQSEELMRIRSKTPTPRPLVFGSDLEKQIVKWINLAGVPLAFVLFGTVRLLRRRRVTRKTYGDDE